jgi:competence protein ComEA
MVDKRKAEVAAYAVAAFLMVFFALRFLNRAPGGGAPVSLDPPGASTQPRDAARASGPAPPAKSLLVVDVAGEVHRPGVYRIPAGSRADAAVQQAGGVTRSAERSAVNLAMPLHDGQQIVVPRRGAAASAAAGAGGSAASGAGSAPGAVPAQPVSLSSATVEQLDTLDGIGPTLAARIVQYRDAHGGFRSVEELRQVSGIGDKRFAALRKAVQP